jgi:CRP/FNR family cyclic AMP-dependent transcriptional regulator
VFLGSGKDEVVLATLKRGDIIGEMALIDNQPRMASARAVGDTQLTVMMRDDLDQRLAKLSESDKVLRRLIDVFVDRLRGQSGTSE